MEFRIRYALQEAPKDVIWAVVTSILAVLVFARAAMAEGLANIWCANQGFHVALSVATNLLVVALIARRPYTFAAIRTPLLASMRVHRIAAIFFAVPSYAPPFQRAFSPSAATTPLSIAVTLSLIALYHAIFHFGFKMLGPVQAIVAALINVIPVTKEIAKCTASTSEVAATLGSGHAGLTDAIDYVTQWLLPVTWPNRLGQIAHECARTRAWVLLSLGLFAPLTATVVLEERARHRFLMCTGRMHLPPTSLQHPMAVLNFVVCWALQAWCLWQMMAAAALIDAAIAS